MKLKIQSILSILFACVFLPHANAQITITELHYNPADEQTVLGDDLEFIEITNLGSNSVNIAGYSFVAGISYVFGTGTIISAGESFVLCKNKIAAENFYGTTFQGQYSGGLKNSSETITLIDKSLNSIATVTYADKAPWSTLADGLGSSLELINPDDIDNYASWSPSTERGGTPGVYNQNLTIIDYPIYVNEVLANTDGLDKIELKNSSDTSVNIGSWYITDDRKDPFKYQLPENSIISPNGFLVIDENDFGTHFSLSSKGEEVYLFSADNSDLTGYSHGLSFNVSELDQSFGRHVNSDGKISFFNQTSQTFGSENDEPIVGPLVFTDLMYNPDVLTDEFLIIKNISDSSVSSNSPYLADSNGIRVNGIGFKFDFNNPQVFESNESFILTSININTFRSKYAIDENVKIFQFTGSLSNSNELLEIEIPVKRDVETDDLGTLVYDNHYKTMDAFWYYDEEPWPVEADGSGSYLRRISNSGYANEPLQWQAVNYPVLGLLDSKFNAFSLNIYPNPTASKLNIDTEKEIVSYKILSTTGTIVSQGNFMDTIDVTNLDNGVYILELHSSDSSISQRFIKND